MADNQVHEEGSPLSVVCTAPATPASGDPVMYGQRPGVALTDERADGTTTVAFKGVFELAVVGANNAGNVAVAAGDILYYEVGVINKDNVAGVRFGYAGGAVLTGATTTIEVILGY